MATASETKEEKFVRLAEKRTRRVLEGLRLIGNLSNRGNYSWTQDQVDKIFSTLEDELQATRERFEDAEFSLE